MISDFSGVIFDYAFIFRRPVIYADTSFDPSPYDACWLKDEPIWSFEILPKVDNYPKTYDELTDVAKEEQNQNARPEIASKIENFDSYDTIYLGYPIWWGDLPMICYTFLESYDFSGKTIVPFCTHEGSGNAGTQSKIQSVVKNATVKEVLAITGTDTQKDPDSVKTAVTGWLNGSK